MKSKAGKEQFLKQLQDICAGLEGNVAQASVKRDAATELRDQKQEQLTQLLERQRRYFKCVKDFQDACDVNEKLSERIQAAS